MSDFLPDTDDDDEEAKTEERVPAHESSVPKRKKTELRNLKSSSLHMNQMKLWL